MRKAGALVAAVVATGLTLGPPPSVQAQTPLRIGASLSQTGPYAPLALNQLRGYQLCVKHVNEKGGVLGRRVELVVEDDQSEPALAARIYQKLIGQDKVDAILGPYSSPLTEAVADLAEKDGERLRAAILKMDTNTVYGAFKVDGDGLQIGHRMLVFQWQDGKKAIVWPDELAPGQPRFPTPPWSQR